MFSLERPSWNAIRLFIGIGDEFPKFVWIITKTLLTSQREILLIPSQQQFYPLSEIRETSVISIKPGFQKFL